MESEGARAPTAAVPVASGDDLSPVPPPRSKVKRGFQNACFGSEWQPFYRKKKAPPSILPPETRWSRRSRSTLQGRISRDPAKKRDADAYHPYRALRLGICAWEYPSKPTPLVTMKLPPASQWMPPRWRSTTRTGESPRACHRRLGIPRGWMQDVINEITSPFFSKSNPPSTRRHSAWGKTRLAGESCELLSAAAVRSKSRFRGNPNPAVCLGEDKTSRFLSLRDSPSRATC
jgi:hypothetical protein